MWNYKSITRSDFEKRKKQVEQIICEQGGEMVEISLPYFSKTISICGENQETGHGANMIFRFENYYFRIDEVLFLEKPFIVIEYGTLQDLLHNTMDDADPFPYDLCKDEIVKEVKYALGIHSDPII